MSTIIDFTQERAALIEKMAKQVEVIDCPMALDNPSRARSNIGFNCPEIWASPRQSEKYRFSAIRACSLIVAGVPGMGNSLESPNTDYGKGNLYPLLQKRFNRATLSEEWDYEAKIWDALGKVLACN